MKGLKAAEKIAYQISPIAGVTFTIVSIVAGVIGIYKDVKDMKQPEKA